MMPSKGDKAPAFNLKDADGRPVRLSDFKGRKLVLYFYPRDMTPGCTKEACSFRDDLPRLTGRNVAVAGVSTDTSESHRKFREKHDLNFTLLSDPDHDTAEKYGVWQEKNMYGKKSWGIRRTTFIIDEQGRIAHIFKKVDTSRHSEEVLEALDSLDAE